MNVLIQNKLEKIINNNLPLIQSTINERVLPQIQGSIQDKGNQTYAFHLLYKTLDKIPIINIITTFINEDAFVEFCMPHASKYLGTNDFTENEFDSGTENKYLSITNTEESPSIAKLFVADELLKLKELIDIDIMTMDEYNEKKKKIIGMHE